MGKLLVVFTVVPLLEAFLLVAMGNYVGFWPTIAVVVVTAFVGAFLGKREGLKVWRDWQNALGRGEMPEEGIIGGVLVLIGGVLLVTPGVLTDITGVLLLIPSSRRVIAKYVRRYLETKFGVGAAMPTMRHVRVDLGNGHFAQRVERHYGGDPNVIEAEGSVIEERRRSENA